MGCCLQAEPRCGRHTGDEAFTYLSAEAVGRVDHAVSRSAGLHGALNGPRRVETAPVVQGQAVLRWWWWGRWERGERWRYQSLLTASTILRALMGDGEGRVRSSEHQLSVVILQ